MSLADDADHHAWALAQADAARRRSANEIDWDRLAEELEAMARSERRALFSHLRILLLHLAKWEAQPALRSNSWRLSIQNARDAVAKLLAESPSLASVETAEFEDAWRFARRDAAAETGLSLEGFAVDAPFTPGQAKDATFWPGGAD